MEYDIWIWLAVIVVSLIMEFITMDVTSIWFAFGGVVAIILASLKVSTDIQVLVFIAVSAVLIVTLRRWAKNKLLNSSESANKIDLMKQEKSPLLTKITKTQKGTVKYNGVVWNAISEDNEPIDEGTDVVVVKVKGNTLIVKKGE